LRGNIVFDKARSIIVFQKKNQISCEEKNKTFIAVFLTRLLSTEEVSLYFDEGNKAKTKTLSNKIKNIRLKQKKLWSLTLGLCY
jgi:hypothetical protein